MKSFYVKESGSGKERSLAATVFVNGIEQFTGTWSESMTYISYRIEKGDTYQDEYGNRPVSMDEFLKSLP